MPGLCSMEQLGSYCLTEPGAGSDAAALRTTAVRDGDDYVLNGVKQFISGAGTSDVYVVMARTGGAGAARASRRSSSTEGHRRAVASAPNEQKMGWNAQPTRQVILDDVRVPAANRLGAEGDGFRIAMAGLNGGRLNIAACSLGGAPDARWSAACAYLPERKAFGGRCRRTRPCSSSSPTWPPNSRRPAPCCAGRAAALDAGAPDAVELCAMAKRFATDAGFEVANKALQLHGGYGYLAEYGIEKIVRDLRVHQILEGTNEIMRVIIARELAGSRETAG